MFTNSIDTSDIRVLQCVHDYKTTVKKLKIRAFAQFHTCQLFCVKDLNTQGAETCFKQCERELDEYFTRKGELRSQKEVFYALPIYSKNQKKQYIVPEEQAQEYQKKTVQFEQASQQKLQVLSAFLDERGKKYKI